MKISNGSTSKSCAIGSDLTIETPEKSYLRLPGMFIVEVENISLFVLVFLLLAMNKISYDPIVIYLFEVNSKSTRTTSIIFFYW